jgi:hypothetical protein
LSQLNRPFRSAALIPLTLIVIILIALILIV